MMRLPTILLCCLVLTSHANAFTGDVQLPNLTFPGPGTTPTPEPSRACIAPGHLTRLGCVPAK